MIADPKNEANLVLGINYLYNTKAIKKTIVKDFKKKVMKRKQIKRKYKDDDDYTESNVCLQQRIIKI